MSHHCHARGCTSETSQPFCDVHWAQIPTSLQCTLGAKHDEICICTITGDIFHVQAKWFAALNAAIELL